MAAAFRITRLIGRMNRLQMALALGHSGVIFLCENPISSENLAKGGKGGIHGLEMVDHYRFSVESVCQMSQIFHVMLE